MQCSECGGIQIYTDSLTGETTCQHCGVVLSSASLNTGPEWRAFDQRQIENRTRTGALASLMIYDKGLNTNISWRDPARSLGLSSSIIYYANILSNAAHACDILRE